ncbi:MAG: hypothetical protein ACRD0O_02825 [Acidimicrobiia bacterium]
MSIAVELDRLRDETARYGASAYLLTTGTDGRPHAVATAVRWEGDRLAAPAGNRTLGNVAGCPLVSFLWPPTEPDGYTLIVDAEADVVDGTVSARPTRGVLHRPGPAQPPRPSCTSDCVPLLGP